MLCAITPIGRWLMGRGFGLSIINKGEVEMFSMDGDGYTKRIDKYTFKFCPFCGKEL